MKNYRVISILCLVLALTAVGGATAKVLQTANSLQIGAFTLSVPSTNPAVTVLSPARAGTLALREDLPPVAPGTTVYAGQITVNGSATFSGIANTPVCTLTPRFTTSANGLQVTVIDYVCTAKNN